MTLFSILVQISFGDEMDIQTKSKLENRTIKAIDPIVKIIQRFQKKQTQKEKISYSSLEEEQFAENIELQWEVQKQILKGEINGLAIGDHPPLSKFLDRLDQLARQIFGSKYTSKYYFTDIRLFNFTIPVVFRPRDSRWNREDYKDHFKNFYAATSYWVSYGLCVLASNQWSVLSPHCNKISKGTRYISRVFIGPRLGSTIYSKANRKSAFVFDQNTDPEIEVFFNEFE